jgi:hypothetical protein
VWVGHSCPTDVCSLEPAAILGAAGSRTRVSDPHDLLDIVDILETIASHCIGLGLFIGFETS